jgi:hypothetical protein
MQINYWRTPKCRTRELALKCVANLAKVLRSIKSKTCERIKRPECITANKQLAFHKIQMRGMQKDFFHPDNV